MTYTSEFEKWVYERYGAAPSWSDCDMNAEAHFWLSAFARLVREEAESTRFSERHDCIRFQLAFNSICAKFGLEVKP